eukprot:TRINITY_DN7712_c0_g1_i1.p1 TRINITY_DN7712_c0_g1~~TRINITY_DN7712_c0_g1_i1.p1  ORF type:complete len:129 (-),score=16.77 TRINITY_DN7712_c0_g1_i1:41-397(-)
MGNKAFRNPHHDRWLITENGYVRASHHKHHQHAVWHVEHHNGLVSLRSHTGKYLAADHSHNVYLTDSHHHHDAKFHLEHHHGLVAIRSHHGRYIGVHGDELRASHEKGHSELFEEVNV